MCQVTALIHIGAIGAERVAAGQGASCCSDAASEASGRGGRGKRGCLQEPGIAGFWPRGGSAGFAPTAATVQVRRLRRSYRAATRLNAATCGNGISTWSDLRGSAAATLPRPAATPLPRRSRRVRSSSVQVSGSHGKRLKVSHVTVKRDLETVTSAVTIFPAGGRNVTADVTAEPLSQVIMLAERRRA